jgi:hypothetical protein
MNPLIAGTLMEAAKGLIARIWPDPAQQAEAQQRLLELQQKGELVQIEAALQVQLAQIEVNKLDAQGNWFQRGWRPCIGWTCALALFFYYVPYMIAATVLWVMQVLDTNTLVARPDLGVADLLGLTFSLLGMSGLRSFEKLKGVDK